MTEETKKKRRKINTIILIVGAAILVASVLGIMLLPDASDETDTRFQDVVCRDLRNIIGNPDTSVAAFDVAMDSFLKEGCPL